MSSEAAPVAIIALLVLGLVAGLLLVSGSSKRLPTPYGPAANGSVAFAAEGDIFTVDTESRVTTAIVSGSRMTPIRSGPSTGRGSSSDGRCPMRQAIACTWPTPTVVDWCR